jgi:ATP-dependent helicase/nuclease subunit A
MNQLKVYKSSAGSGKTFTLVLEYLKIILQKPEDYKSVLAITFTNKAAGEMKTRIVETLVSLSNGEDIPARKILEEDELLKKVNLTLQSARALKLILHDYTSFSVSTIDSFFQRILRSLAREIHLPLNMEVQVEIDDAILEVTDQLLKEVGVDKELTEWLTRLALQKMDDDKGWNLERDIDNVARQIFREEHNVNRVLTRVQIQEYYEELKAQRRLFEDEMKKMGDAVLASIKSAGLSLSDFTGGERSFANYFRKITSPKTTSDFDPGKSVLKAAADPDNWAAKSSPLREQIVAFAEENIQSLSEIISYVDANLRDHKTVVEILKKIYLFGIVNDLQKKFSEYRNTNNVILLSDTTRLLNDVIKEGDTPFIYEQTGNRYKHLLIDEFQDTSLLQWKNLLPLIINTLGSGNTALVVGDAKQSIYRWRGGNMNLLLNNIYNDLSQFKSLFSVEKLGINYRSRLNVVNFNNTFFKSAPSIVNDDLSLTGFGPLELAYGTDLHQETVSNNAEGGYVKIRFLPNEKDDEGNSVWKETAKKEMLENIRTLLASGYAYRDICILVRRNSEGNDIADFLYDNKIEEVISADSLLISVSPKIQFLINVIRFLNNSRDVIARSEIIYYYQRFLSRTNEPDWHSVFVDFEKTEKRRKKKDPNEVLFEGLEDNLFNRILPEPFTSNLGYLAKLPLYELVEQLISIFGLNHTPDAYVQCFQDLILECTVKINTSIDGFLQWWDNSNRARDASVNVPENKDAIRIMTIHSSKGLQFPVVMIPFAEWQLKPKPNETLWMRTKGSKFDKIGEVAVASSSRLLETFFQEQYELELSQTIVDNLNLLYVAFTRAEEKLFVFSPADNENELNTVSKLIFRTCSGIKPEFDRMTFEEGTHELRHEQKIKKVKVVPGYLESYPSNRWQDRLSLTSHAQDLADLIEHKKISKINYGILVHSILAAVKELDEIDPVIEKIVYDGLISEEEKKNLADEIKAVLEVDEIRELFDKSYTALAERELILPTGEILRPDRVVIRDNKAIVVDFKTGKREKKHETQVKQYADVLRQMNYAQVNSKVIYLSEREIENVV